MSSIPSLRSYPQFCQRLDMIAIVGHDFGWNYSAKLCTLWKGFDDKARPEFDNRIQQHHKMENYRHEPSFEL